MQISLDNRIIHIPRSVRYATISKWGAIVGGVLVLLGLMLVRQPLYPAPWFDEGLFVSMAATLARDGVYALPDSSGARIMDPAINTGPTVLVPLALVFRGFGVGLLQARLMMLFFAVLALVVYGLLARQLLGWQASALAIALLLVGNRELFASFVPMSRQVLGEVPALSYTLLGLWIWLSVAGQNERRWQALVLSGLAWGIAIVTKLQMALIIFGCIGALALLDRCYYRQVDWWSWLVPAATSLGVVLVWYAAQVAIIGLASAQQHALVLQDSTATQIILSLNLAHWRNACSVLWRSGWLLWGLPGLVWGLWQARKPTATGFRHAVVLALPLVNLFWFAFLSIGWGRYAFLTFVLTPLWSAGLLWQIGQGRVLTHLVHQSRIAMIVLVSCYVVWNGMPLARNLIAPIDSGYLEMNTYLKTQLRDDALIESWEWELSLEAPQPIHHPSSAVMFTTIETMMNRQSIQPSLYHPGQARPQYLLTGPFSDWTGIYQNMQRSAAPPVASFGAYRLYRLSHP